MKITTTPASAHVAALAREAERKKLGWCVPEPPGLQPGEATPRVPLGNSHPPVREARRTRGSLWLRAARKSTEATATAGRALIRASKRPVNWLIGIGALATGGDYVISAVRAAVSVITG